MLNMQKKKKNCSLILSLRYKYSKFLYYIINNFDFFNKNIKILNMEPYKKEKIAKKKEYK